MADDPRKNPNEQSGSGQSQKSGQDYDQRNKGQQGQQDIPKKNPTHGEDEEKNDQQQGGQRRAS
jgi:hypothetical protein